MAAEGECSSNVATPPQEPLGIEQSDSLDQQNHNPSGHAVTSGNLNVSPILPQRIGFEPSPALPVRGENHRAAHSQGPAAQSKKPGASSTKAGGVRKRPSQKAKAAEMHRQQQEEDEEMMAIVIQQQQELMAVVMFAAVAVARQQSSCGIM
jgi:hypothetical protein